MADLSMCQYADCEKSNSCYRFLAKPNENYQAYMHFENICSPKNQFQWYWQTKEELIKKEGDE